MRHRLIFTDKSVNDIIQAKTWYEKQQKGLGEKFADTVFKCSREIQLAPLGYPNKYKYTREKYIKKFPYLIIYSVEEDVIFILRVFSCKKDSKKKYKNIS
jgi:toxin ParE1/3/4